MGNQSGPLYGKFMRAKACSSLTVSACTVEVLGLYDIVCVCLLPHTLAAIIIYLVAGLAVDYTLAVSRASAHSWISTYAPCFMGSTYQLPNK